MGNQIVITDNHSIINILLGDFMIIDTYRLNGTVINIHDDYLPKNESEQQVREKQLKRLLIKIVKNTAKPAI